MKNMTCGTIRINGAEKTYDYLLIGDVREGDTIKLPYGCNKYGILYNEGKVEHIWKMKPIPKYISKKIIVDSEKIGTETPVTKKDKEEYNKLQPDEELGCDKTLVNLFTEFLLVGLDRIGCIVDEEVNKDDLDKINAYKSAIIEHIIAIYRAQGKIF